MLGAPRAPLLFTRLPFTCPTCLTCLHFLVCLTSPDLLRLLCALIFYLPSFFYVSCVASPFDVLTSLHFLLAFFLRTCVPFLRAVHAFYLRASAFLVYLHIFYVPLFLLSALSFSLTLLFFIFLHALRCLNFSSQLSNKGGKGDIDFFIFLDPFRGNKDLFRVFQLRNYFFFRYYVFFQVDNKHLDGNIFLTLVITSRGLPYFEKICMHWN